MKRLVRILLWTLTGGGIAVFALAAFFYFPPIIQPLYLSKLKYEIPDNYRGWVLFEVNNPHCAPLPHRGRFLVYVVDAKGHGCTSDPAAEGWRTVKYEYIRADGKVQSLPETGWGEGGLIWDTFYRMSGNQRWYVFFIGTEQEFHLAENGPIG